MRVPPLLLALAAAMAQRALTQEASRPTVARTASSGASAAVSVATMGSAIRQFRLHRTTVDPLRPDGASALVTAGPFSFTRNPMYVGMAGLLVAHAVLRGSPRALAPVAVFATVIDQVQIPPEEAAMAALFGAEFEAYRSRVPRWIAVR
jgi:protein-S-isoprenylcysteine O-methyltransferase Ste14